MATIMEPPTVEPDPGEKLRRRNELIRVFVFVSLTVILGAIAGAFVGLKTVFLFKKEMHLSADDVNTMQIFLGLPGYFAPFMGVWFDLVPFLGFHRSTYYFLGKLMGVAGYLGLAFLHQYHYVTVFSLMLLIGAGGAIRGVILNAIVVALGNRTGRFGQFQAIMSFIPLGMSIWFTADLNGYVAKNWSNPMAFGLAALVILISTPLVFMIDEKRVTGGPHASETAAEHAARIAAKQAERERNREALLKAAATPALWIMVIYVFYLIITPGLNLVQTYYMNDKLGMDEQVIGSLGKWSSIGALIAFGIFGLTSRRWPVFLMVWGAWLMDCLSYPSLFFLHDKTSAIYITLFGGVVGSLYGISLNTLAARACPPGIEGTIYGLFQAAILFAGVLSEKFGSMLYKIFGPDNKAHNYDLVHAWNWSLYVGLAFTVAGVIFIPFLPAWTRSRDPIGKVIEADATAHHDAAGGPVEEATVSEHKDES